MKEYFPSNALLEEQCPFLPLKECPEILVRQAANIFDLWGACEKESGQKLPVPHWAVAWPAARLLSRFFLDNRKWVMNKKVLEIGCGGAAASIAAKIAGAIDVTANDIDPMTLSIAGENALKNLCELRFDPESHIKPNGADTFDVILLADFFYFKTESQTLIPFLQEWKKQGKIILIADGGRAFAPRVFSETLEEKTLPVDIELEGVPSRNVRISKF